MVWVTRYRRKIFSQDGVKEYLRKQLYEVQEHFPDWELIETGIAKDHIHVQMGIPPKYAVSDVVRVMKSNTSREMRKEFDFLSQVYWDDRGIWGRGYFVSTIGIDENIIRNYVASQEQEETDQAQLEL